MSGDHYAEVTLDESWILRERLARKRRQIERGFALRRSSPDGTTIEATTNVARTGLAEQLLSVEILESHRDKSLDLIQLRQRERPLDIRTVFTHVITDEAELFRSVIRIETEPGSYVLTTPAHLENDLEYLLGLGNEPSRETADIDDLPTLWLSGSGGVVMHEAVGHPAGIAAPAQWPEWIDVSDTPGIELFETMIRGSFDDTATDLLTSSPGTLRRATFRDPPLQRMTNLVVSAPRAPFSLPSKYVEIELTAGGGWDPLLDEVHVDVSRATLVEGERRSRLSPFVFVAERCAIAAALAGARGPATRYRGVLCAEQGQWLPVGTYSPDLLLERIG